MHSTVLQFPTRNIQDSLALKFANGTTFSTQLGEVTMINSPTHGFSAGMVYSTLVHFCLLNKPVVRFPERKPLILLFDQDTKPADSLLWMYRYLKENIEGVAITHDTVDHMEVMPYVDGHLTTSGFTYEIASVGSDECDMANVLEYIEDTYPADEFDLQALLINPGKTFLSPKEGVPEKEDPIPYNLQSFRHFCQYRGTAGIITLGFMRNVMELQGEMDTKDNIPRITLNNADYLEHGEEVLKLADNQLVVDMHAVGTSTWLNYGYHSKGESVIKFGEIDFEDLGSLPFTYVAG